jgi:cellulose biosynthesis protein BcsQ
MTNLNFFRKDKRPVHKSGNKNKNFNIIIADNRWETFETLLDVNDNYNLLNLSSEFAVNFILDYEKIDLIIISLKIGGLEAIVKKAERKKVKVYLLGKDLNYPVDRGEVLSIIKKECDEKIIPKKSDSRKHLINSFGKIFKLRPDVNISPENSVDHLTASLKLDSNNHVLEKPTDKKTPNIRSSRINNINVGYKNTRVVDIWSTKTEDAIIENSNTEIAGTGDPNTNVIDFEDKDTESESTRDINTFYKNIDNANINFINTSPEVITDKKNGPSETKFSNNKKVINEQLSLKLASIKYAKMKPDKEPSRKSQFYNDFWKEVTIEADDSIVDNNYNEEIRKPNQNMHKYLRKNENFSKQHLANSTEVEDENLLSAPGRVITIKQKIMVFVKAKGGVGSTFLSLYLAYEFRNLRTLLIDLNFSEGGSDIGYYLGMPKSPNMVIFTEGYNRISMDNSVINFKGYFDILQPPPSYDLTKKLEMQDIYSIVDVAKRKYHLLIFDLPNQIDDIFFGVLDMADLTIMVSDYTPGSIGRLASINKRFIYNDMEKILVLNKNKNNKSHSFIKNNISEFISLKEIVSIDENSLLSGKSDFKECDFLNNKDMQGFKKKVMESLTCD